MTSDYKEMLEWFRSENAIPKTILRMRKEFPALSLWDIKSQSNARFKGILCLAAIEGAKDFDTMQTLENARENDKDHLFPEKEYSVIYKDIYLSTTN